SVTGPTGAGKTSFINLVAGSSLEVGNSLRSCTSGVQTVQCIVAGEQVTFIDTPGFDDTYKSQADILKDIADFLEQTYEGGRKLTGVIYMHRISDVRVGGIARENFRLFKKICGRGAMKNVVIVTTMWDEVPEEVGARREQELASKSLFFKDALDDGAKMHRHCGQITTAQTSMSPFLRFLPETLQLQRELVDEMRVLPETTAGDELQRSLDEQADAHRRQMLDL
ncbi:nucleoside triphosphate hydrolase protein, partial [Wolfiporia cocos MD-104 SS10]